MKRAAILICIILISSVDLYGQDQKGLYPRDRYSFAFFGGEFGYDAGLGMEIGSPSFFNNRFCIRVRGNVNWSEQVKADLNRWATYKSIGANLIYNFLSVDRGRIYIEAGTFIIVPNKTFSGKCCQPGLNVSTGTELFVINNSSLDIAYYFSGGIGFSRATAEKLENHPKYANGFIFANGFRFYF